MSKKSRRRNKKILAVLGALGAATMLGRRKKGNVERTAAMEDANVGINTGPSLIDAESGGTDFIKKDSVIIPKSKPAVIKKADDSWLDTPKWVHGAGGKGDYWRRKKDEAYETGEHYTPDLNPYKIPSARVHKRSVKPIVGPAVKKKTPNFYPEILPYKHGGRVQLAKRGLGRAFTKSKK
tara:strand:- start:790 stop:1329 length:540 start_codon:yes stop_codon:yes gene_type:complete